LNKFSPKVEQRKRFSGNAHQVSSTGYDEYEDEDQQFLEELEQHQQMYKLGIEDFETLKDNFDEKAFSIEAEEKIKEVRERSLRLSQGMQYNL
jgi:hypothetical protein